MARQSRLKPIVLASASLAAVGGWILYSVFAAQARPGAPLAQAPLNTQVQIPPAFIMAVDDSGSMTFQTQFPSRDGGALWARDSASQPYGFFHSSGGNAGTLRRSDSTREFVHVAPYPAPRQGSPGNDNAAIPPIDEFGFSRSHVYNPAYFNPFFEYQPWVDSLGRPWPLPDPENTRVHPSNASPTVDLTAERASTSSSNATHHAFRLRSGMVMPDGLKYYDDNTARNCGLTQGRSAPAGNGWRRLTQQVTVGCNGGNVYIAYFPATFYLPADMAPPSGYDTSKRVEARNACTYRTATGAARCDMYRYEIRPDHYVSNEAYQRAIQNFANWFSFYGNRNRAMVAGMTRSLAEVTNMRVGYFTINQRSAVTMRDMSVAGDKAALFSDVIELPAAGNTPNLPAVRHMGEQFRRTDRGAPVQLACQRNAGMLFTDGFSNVAQSAPAINGLGAPFDPTPANSLAAIATSYYLNTNNTVGSAGVSPLRTGAGFPAGQVPVPAECAVADRNSTAWKRLDCQSNLHMNFYGVTLGSRGVIFDPDLDQDPYELNPAWPGYQSNQRSTIDDIWHATVNTRGELINARSPADIVDAMRRILNAVSAGASPSGSIGMTGARIGVGSLSVVPEYEVANDGTDWFGKLTASRIEVDRATGNVVDTTFWEASSRFPGHETRAGQVFFGRGNSAHAFNAGNVDLEDLCDKPADLYPGMSRCSAEALEELGATPADAVRYLLGDTSLERRNGGYLRDRGTVLGDIVNSTPVVSSPRDDYGYRALSGSRGSSYRDYLSAKASRPYMVYVGANAGMLHAFHGGMNADGESSGTGGREVFGYIPATALGHMGNLLFPYEPGSGADQRFDHRYYVDGPLTVSDVCGTACSAAAHWSTVLVGSSGAGGRSVFALDVSDPTGFSAGDRLWEISDLDASLPDRVRENIGFVLGAPVIVPVRTGDTVSWKAIFGNGYNSAGGKAVLFVVDLSSTFSPTGSIRMIEAEESGAPPGPNGLGNIVVVDRRHANGSTWVRDGYADTVYAADQKGAVWKFDLLDDSNAALTTPFFTTAEHREDGVTYRQPITGGMTAATGARGGVMLYFGTGSFSFVGDPEDDSIQSLYAVNDTVNGAITTTLTRTSLQRRSVGTSADGVRTLVADNDVPLVPRGWYVDLPAGERFVGNPRIASGIVFLPTYAPRAENRGCSTGGFNWLFGLNARTGAAGLSNARQGSPEGERLGGETAAVELDTSGTAPVRDVAVNVLPRLTPAAAGNPGDPPPAPPEQGCWMTVTAAGLNNGFFLPYPCGRQSWRQVQ